MEQVQVTFRNMSTSDALEKLAREKADKLQRLFPRITSCHVVVETTANRTAKGNVCHVRIDVSAPGAELAAHHEPPPHTFDDAYSAMRTAFDMMRRQLEQHFDKLRGDVKTHGEPLPGFEATYEPAQGKEGPHKTKTAPVH
ncbi:HPF/RaiA family ribosome-associated protein [Chondromyces crocatus]|uniref:Uncharacterized protein n=1 Tax=Chondromyces crocatus TaxID=52 RepID=A0A0K1EIT9_CHOCO|nr:HPF/RaiA family ribosome-associated protein [Chondromyces crocatus]AKT40779.1 uncharacterized protein CMC5_049350 [Chondromyces crocatus]